MSAFAQREEFFVPWIIRLEFSDTNGISDATPSTVLTPQTFAAAYITRLSHHNFSYTVQSEFPRTHSCRRPKKPKAGVALAERVDIDTPFHVWRHSFSMLISPLQLYFRV